MIFLNVENEKSSVSEIAQDTVILMKFLTRRVYAESTGKFSQKSFSAHFWGPSLISA